MYAGELVVLNPYACNVSSCLNEFVCWPWQIMPWWIYVLIMIGHVLKNSYACHDRSWCTLSTLQTARMGASKYRSWELLLQHGILLVMIVILHDLIIIFSSPQFDYMSAISLIYASILFPWIFITRESRLVECSGHEIKLNH